jgi:hypothetical protein
MASSYDDLASPAEMLDDCRATGRNLRLEQAVRRAGRPAPSLSFDDQPAERPKRDIEVSEAAARLAGALHFHLE